MTQLPADWEERPLSHVARLSSGGTPQAKNPAYYGGDIPWAVIGDLNDGVVKETAQAITQAGLDSSSAKIVPAGTVLIGMYGSIGKLGIAGTSMSTNQAIATIQASDELDNRYLFYYLLAQRRDLDRQGKGATQRNISQTILKPWPIRFPRQIDEQRRIVDLLEDHLSRLDAASDYLASSRRRLVALERSALDVQFGGEDIPLSDLIEDISAGKSFGAANAPAREDEWGIIKVSAMTWGEFNATENKAVADEGRVDPRFEIRSGDLLVSRANTSELVGASVLVKEVRPKLLLSDKSLRVTPRSDVDAEWLWRVLQAPSARRQISALATGTKDSMRNISQAALQRVLLPNLGREGQTAALGSFAEVADAVTLLRGEIEREAVRLVALRRSLMAAAFSGRLGAESALSAAEEMIGA